MRSLQLPLDRGEQRRHAAEAGHVARFEEIGELAVEEAHGRRVWNQRRAGDERNPGFLDREIEGDRYALIGPVAWRESVEFRGDADEIADAGMRNRDPFGMARRA